MLAPATKATPLPADSFSRAQGGPLQSPDFSKGSRFYPAEGGWGTVPLPAMPLWSHHQDRDATALCATPPTQIVSWSLQPNSNWGCHHRKTSRMGFQKLPGAQRGCRNTPHTQAVAASCPGTFESLPSLFQQSPRDVRTCLTLADSQPQFTPEDLRHFW